MKIHDLNNLSSDSKKAALLQCCGSTRWVNALLSRFPFTTLGDLVNASLEIWYEACGEADWREAFSHHPKIGNVKDLRKKFTTTAHLSEKEQSEVAYASAEILQQLANGNEEYEKKNGFIFIVCASGKSAGEMYRLLEDRLRNSKSEELALAMGEQAKITNIRLQNLFFGEESHIGRSQLTTHVLDTSLGSPGKDLTIRLQGLKEGRWQTIAQGVTNADGRIGDLLPAGRILPVGNYQMVFETGDYFKHHKIVGFYPEVSIQFTIFDDQHYHVPLLLNPFGYSTYKGS